MDTFEKLRGEERSIDEKVRMRKEKSIQKPSQSLPPRVIYSLSEEGTSWLSSPWSNQPISSCGSRATDVAEGT